MYLATLNLLSTFFKGLGKQGGATAGYFIY